MKISWDFEDLLTPLLWLCGPAASLIWVYADTQDGGTFYPWMAVFCLFAGPVLGFVFFVVAFVPFAYAVGGLIGLAGAAYTACARSRATTLAILAVLLLVGLAATLGALRAESVAWL